MKNQFSIFNKNETLTCCIVISTLNSERTIERCLRTIFQQDYSGIEVIIVDGGSTDKTLFIAKKFPVKIIVRRGLDSESAKAVGLLATKADVYCDMAADNYLPEKDFIRSHLSVLSSLSKDEVVAAYPERYYYDKNDSLLNRYFALLGVNDPLAYYLGKADRKGYLNYQLLPRQSSGPRFGSAITNYQTVEFNENNMPTLGANGFFIKRKLLLAADIKHFYHIDVIYDLIKKYGRLKFVAVNTSIGHDTGENLGSFLKKRRNYFENLYLKNIEKRRYHLYDPKRDFVKLVLFVLFALTFVEPVILSVRGYLKLRDKAWFLHPVICFLTVVNYGFSYYRHKK